MRFQSPFMLMTIQPSFFASSYSACVKVPTFAEVLEILKDAQSKYDANET
jgi:hypothetical protein